MDAISQPLASQSAQPQATAATLTPDTPEDAATALTADFETFLKLLTTQMQNQDPQNPQDSTEFVSQLASFSAVEQQISTNTKLDSLISALSGDATAQMAGWIGAEVRSNAAARFDGTTPIEAYYDLPADTFQAQMTISSAQGAQIAQIALEPGSSQFIWDGKGSDGLTAPDGLYSFEVEAFSRTASLGKGPAETFSTVTEVRQGDTGLTLVFSDKTQLPVNDVTAVR